MSARCPVYVKVAHTVFKWIEVSAVTLDEAEDFARNLPDVTAVIWMQYEPPGDATHCETFLLKKTRKDDAT